MRKGAGPRIKFLPDLQPGVETSSALGGGTLDQPQFLTVSCSKRRRMAPGVYTNNGISHSHLSSYQNIRTSGSSATLEQGAVLRNLHTNSGGMVRTQAAISRLFPQSGEMKGKGTSKTNVKGRAHFAENNDRRALDGRIKSGISGSQGSAGSQGRQGVFQPQKSGQVAAGGRGSSRPGTPALSQATLNIYGAGAQGGDSRKQAFSRQNFRRKGSNPYGSIQSGGRSARQKRLVAGIPRRGVPGSANRLRNRAFGVEKQTHNASVPQILSYNGNTASGENSRKTTGKHHTAPKKSATSVGRSGFRKPKTGKRQKIWQKKRRPASAEPSRAAASQNAMDQRGGTATKATSGSRKKNGKGARPASAQNKSSSVKIKSGTAAGARQKLGGAGPSGQNARSTVSTAGTIASFIHRFRHGGPKSPEERKREMENSNSLVGRGARQVWWKKTKAKTKPQRKADARKVVQIPGQKTQSKKSNYKESSTSVGQDKSPDKQSALSRRSESPARGSGMEAVTALRRRSSDENVDAGNQITPKNATNSSETEDELDRRATALLQRCDAVLTQGKANTSVPSNQSKKAVKSRSKSKQIGKTEKANSPETSCAPTSSQTEIEYGDDLKAVEERSQNVLAHAERLLSLASEKADGVSPSTAIAGHAALPAQPVPEPVLNPRVQPLIASGDKLQTGKKFDFGEVLSSMIFDTVSTNLFGEIESENDEMPLPSVFSGGLAFLLKGSEAVAKTTHADTEDRVLSELERKVKQYEAALALASKKE